MLPIIKTTYRIVHENIFPRFKTGNLHFDDRCQSCASVHVKPINHALRLTCLKHFTGGVFSFIICAYLYSTGELGAWGRYFIDGKRVTDDGEEKWVWESKNTPIKDTWFRSGQPDNQMEIENCIATNNEFNSLDYSYGYGFGDIFYDRNSWEDVYCDGILQAICQYP